MLVTLLWLLFVAGLWLFVWVRLRRLRGRAIINALALLAGQNLPLVNGLRAAARNEKWALRRALEQIALRLEVGDPLSTAVRHAYRAIPGDALGAIQAGERGGTLPSVLRLLAARPEQADQENGPSFPKPLYVAGVLSVLFLVVSAVVVFLIPKLRDIYADYGLECLPPSTERVIAITGALFGPGIGAVLLLAAILLWLQIWIGRAFWQRVPDRFQFLPWVLDSVAWFLPLARKVASVRALARQTPVLQSAIAAGHDLPDAARQAACVDANFHARRRLRRWADAIEAGADPTDAARRAGLPPPLRRAVADSPSPDELQAALAYLSAYYRGVTAHWERVIASALTPVLVLLVGSIVGYVVYAMYMPLKYLLDGVMEEIY